MIEYLCPNCNNNKYNMIKDEANSKLYGYDIWMLKCANCGEEFYNNKYLYLLNTFSKTQKEIVDIVKEFSEDADLMKRNMEKLIGIKTNIGDLEFILRKLNLIYFEEKTDITNSPNTIAVLIESNLPNGTYGKIHYDKGVNSKIEEPTEIDLTNDNNDNIGSIKIVRENNNTMVINIKKAGKKKCEAMTINKPFRIIQVLLRINEMFNYTT